MKKMIILIAAQFLLCGVYGQQNNLTGLEIPDSATFQSMLFPALPKVSFGDGPVDFMIQGFPPVKSQGNIGSCVSWSTGYYLMSQIFQEKLHLAGYFQNGSIDPHSIFNPLYVHNQIKLCQYSCSACGSSNYTALKFLTSVGSVHFDEFRQNPETDQQACKVMPDPTLKDIARNYKLDNYSSLINPYQKYGKYEKYNLVRNALLQNFPVVIGIPVDKNFKDAFNKPNYIWKNYNGNVSDGDNHSMLCVGYSKEKEAICVINSWGSNWANSGFGWIDKDLFDKYLLEAYIVNVPNDFLIPLKKVSEFSYTAQSADTTFEHPLGVNFDKPIESFFINNRYQQFGDLRIIPVSVSKKSAVIKFYQQSKEDFDLLNVTTLSIGQEYSFEMDKRIFRFKIYNIKPWVFLGKKAVYFTLTRIN